MKGEITFKDFAKVMKERKRTIDDLVDLFRGKIEDPREFFERVISCKWKGEDRSWVVIPYRSVIEFYYQELGYLKDSQKEQERQTAKRKRGPMTEERRQIQIEILKKARAAKSVTLGN